MYIVYWFVYLTFFSKRPSAEECHEHRWLLPTEYMIKKRDKTMFNSYKLQVNVLSFNYKYDTITCQPIYNKLLVHRSYYYVFKLQNVILDFYSNQLFLCSFFITWISI